MVTFSDLLRRLTETSLQDSTLGGAVTKELAKWNMDGWSKISSEMVPHELNEYYSDDFCKNTYVPTAIVYLQSFCTNILQHDPFWPLCLQYGILTQLIMDLKNTCADTISMNECQKYIIWRHVLCLYLKHCDKSTYPRYYSFLLKRVAQSHPDAKQRVEMLSECVEFAEQGIKVGRNIDYSKSITEFMNFDCDYDGADHDIKITQYRLRVKMALAEIAFDHNNPVYTYLLAITCVKWKPICPYDYAYQFFQCLLRYQSTFDIDNGYNQHFEQRLLNFQLVKGCLGFIQASLDEYYNPYVNKLTRKMVCSLLKLYRMAQKERRICRLTNKGIKLKIIGLGSYVNETLCLGHIVYMLVNTLGSSYITDCDYSPKMMRTIRSRRTI